MWFAVIYLDLPSYCALRQFIAIKLTHIGPHVAPSTTSEHQMNRLLTRLWYVRFVSNLQRALTATYEFRGVSLLDAVQQAVGRNASAIEQKKLNKARQKFDFAARARLGSALFVGEGNFSFALALARLKGVSPSSILATAHEDEADLGDTAYDNAAKLLKLGAQVKTGVDATCLSKTIGQRRFRTIIFQFPNVASREALYGQNPNHVLVKRFLKSSRVHLACRGRLSQNNLTQLLISSTSNYIGSI